MSISPTGLVDHHERRPKEIQGEDERSESVEEKCQITKESIKTTAFPMGIVFNRIYSKEEW